MSKIKKKTTVEVSNLGIQCRGKITKKKARIGCPKQQSKVIKIIQVKNKKKIESVFEK
jgi:hypothetical protein